MNQITIYDDKQTSRVELEEYFPLRIVFDPAIGHNRFVGFYYGDKSLLEFTVDRQSGIVRQFQIVICENYQIKDSKRDIPVASETGVIALNYPAHFDCDTFILSAYRNCVEIALSSEAANEHYAVGQVLFGINRTHELVSIIVTGVTEEEMSHLENELLQQCD
jgi:hypothetical protein